MSRATGVYGGYVADPIEVHLYRAQPCRLPGGELLLDSVERQRLSTLRRPQDRARYVTTHLLMRAAFFEHTGTPPSGQRFDRTCLICGGAHGKPVLIRPKHKSPAPHVNLSYAGEQVVLALTSAPVGIDIESHMATDFAGFSAVALTAQEAHELLEFEARDRLAAKAAWWTRKEAALKATGHGLRVDATSLRVTPPDRPPLLLEWHDPEIPRPLLTMSDIPVPGSYAGTVAVLGAHRLRIMLHDDAHELLPDIVRRAGCSDSVRV